MTIILSTQRDGFAVLAADRLHGGGRPDYRPKVVRHPSLPLAFAVGGLMVFPVGSRYENATTHLKEIADTITSPSELVLSRIAERVRLLFQPSMDLERDKVQVFIALVKDGKSDVGVQRVSDARIPDDRTRFIPGCGHYIIPECLWDFYRKGSHLDAMNNQTVNEPREVGRLAREAIQAGIDQERALHEDGKNKVIGGDIDVVVVTATAPPLLV